MKKNEMDYRLDLINDLNKHIEKCGENDSLLALSHNSKTGGLICVLNGDWKDLSSLFSIKGYVNTNDDKGSFKDIRSFILNSTINMCNNDKDLKNDFIKKLNNL
jgi:hypothetical protein